MTTFLLKARSQLRILFVIAMSAMASSGMAFNTINPPPPTSTCLTTLTETQPFSGSQTPSGGPGVWGNSTFPDFSSQGNGLLCPGTYTGNAQCVGWTYTWDDIFTCGGDSCGWALQLKDAAGNILASQQYHTGPQASYGNVGTFSSPIVFVTPFTLNTSVSTGIYMTGYIEVGSYYQCTVTVNQVSS